MLRAARAAGAVAVLLPTAVLLGPTAWADGGVECPPFVVNCDINAGDGGTKPGGGGTGGSGGTGTGGTGSGGGGGGGGKAVCVIDDNEVPCFVDRYGWFNPTDRCYWQLMDPQPPADSYRWKLANGIPADWQPGQGALYNRTCLAKGAELMGGTTYSATPPPGQGGGVVIDPAQLAQQAVEAMRLTGANIGIAPKPGSSSLVGLPVWLWNVPSDTTWGPKTGTAAAGGVTVTATAHVERIIWTTGDGATVTCTTAGKAYQPSYGTTAPECGHTYNKAGQYAIGATSKWVVDWSSNTGAAGRIATDRTAGTSVAIAEAQALNTH